jgi:sec-independent protein translocase protein TatC
MKLRLAYRNDPARSRGDEGGTDGFGLSLLEKLDELRRRLVYAAAAVGVGMVIAFTYITSIYEFVFRPIRRVLPPGSKLIYTEPGEAFSVYVEIALIAGVVLATPFLMYQLWNMVAPLLYLRQKKFLVWFVLLTTGGFVGGAAFNHYIAFRWMVIFFASFSSAKLTFLPRLDDVFGLYIKMLLGMGLVFQMPALVYFLAKMGLVTARFLAKQFKYAILIIFIVAAVITPTGDATTQLVFALPMVGLYLISIFIAWVVTPAARPVEEG